jgi:outer membrane protein OmpA-like peptidoglycan-associated protein
MHVRRSFVAVLLALPACKASVSLNAGTRSADANANASVDANANANTDPSAARPRIVHRGDKLAYEGGEIEFETDSANIRGEERSGVIGEFAAVLQKYPALKVRIEGHTDSRGSREYNRKLSDERALAIKNALVRRGVSGERMTSEGLGEDKPARVEPPSCKNKSEDNIPEKKRQACQEVWAENRRAVFIVTEGAEALPPEGAAVSEPTPNPDAAAAVERRTADARRPDWALRFFGGYTLLQPGDTTPQDPLHGGHAGVALHASQRFGKQQRGYIGGGPRLHYRGVLRKDDTVTTTIHEVGPEGNLLVGGGSKKVVGLFSLRVGLGLGAVQVRDTPGVILREARLAGWAMGGLVVLGKLTPRWSLGGHAEAGIAHILGFKQPGPVFEVGLNVAWHFGRGRRDGI